MSNSVLLKAIGLNTFVNQLSEAKPGSLSQADNIVINRDGIIEPCRGFKVYGNSMSAVAKQLLAYKNRIIRHFGTTLQYDNGSGTFTSFSGTYSEPDSTLSTRIKSIEANGNLYFTTSAGIKKMSALSASTITSTIISNSGGIKALDVKLSLNNSIGFLPQDSKVAYRVVWGIKDANNNLILGSPSQREVIENSLTDLLITDFNSLLTNLDTAAALGGDDLSDVNYNSTYSIATNSAATVVQTNLSGLCTKLNADFNIKEHTVVTCVADVASSLNSKYFTFYSANDATKYYIWYSVGGAGVDPAVAGATGVKVDLIVGDSANNVASKTRAKFILAPLSAGFTETGINEFVDFTNVTYGPTTNATNGAASPGFTVAISQEGLSPFSSIKATVDAISFSLIPTTAQLISLQAQYDALVSLLNSYIGAISSPIINASATAFSSSTQSATVDLNITIPSGVTTSHFCQVYRTAIATSVTLSDADPGDEMGLVYEGNPTASEITAGFLTLNDIVPEDFRGANLYTNPNSGETILQANEVPPKAKDLALYKNYLFYANTETKYRKSISLLSVSDLVANTSTFITTDGTTTRTYTFDTAPDTATQKVLISTLDTPGQQVTETARSLVHVINRDSSGLVYAYYLSGSTDVPGLILLESRVLGSNPFYVITNNAAAGGQFSPNISPLNTITAISLANPTSVTSTAHGLTTGDQIIVTSSNSTPTINGLRTVTVTGANTFTIAVNVTIAGTAGSFSKLTSATVSDNEVAPNRVYYSKVNQPEAVPSLNYFDVGPKDKKILRIVALRESLFVFKQDAVYRISGETAPFVVSLFDSSTIITSPDSADVLNNNIYLLSDQGIVRVSDTGIEIISRPIENEINKLNIPSYTNYKTATFGKAYEADRTYYLWTVTNTTDTYSTQCFKFNTLTSSWYRSPISKTCAIVNAEDGKMYLGASDINYLEQERKNFDRTDFANREYDLTITAESIDETNIIVGDVTNINTGDVILQTQTVTISQFNKLLTKLDKDFGVNGTDYFSTLEAVAGDNLSDSLDLLAAKLDADTGVTLTNYASSISGYTDSFADLQLAYNTIVAKLNIDSGVVYTNYLSSSGTVEFEVIITDVTKTSITVANTSITTEYAYPFIAGPATTYAHIESVFKWAPQTFGDPSMLKQVSESTLIFNDTTFSEISLAFASDLQPGFETLMFTGSGNGIFGNNVFGEGNFGGSGNSIPFRVLVPRDKQRCRYMNCKVSHSRARESYSIFGLSLTANVTSTRAYK